MKGGEKNGCCKKGCCKEEDRCKEDCKEEISDAVVGRKKFRDTQKDKLKPRIEFLGIPLFCYL
ncbi:MAG: hypothetical protein ACOYW7_04455 [Nitrospirota bacterium]